MEAEAKKVFLEQWHDDIHHKLAASFEADVHDLGDRILEWSADSSKPFPFACTSDPPGKPVYRTRFELERFPLVDRHWYAERPILLRLRPLNPMEHWQIEAGYWEAINDTKRRDLLRQRIKSVDISAELSSSPIPRTL